MFCATHTFNKKRLALGVVLVALIASSLRPMPVSSAQLIHSGFGPAALSQKEQVHAGQAQNEQTDVPTSQIIIKYKSTSSAFKNPTRAGQMARASAAAGISLEYLREMSGDADVLSLPEALPLAQVQAISIQLMNLPEVDYAEPDQRLLPLMTPNDTYYSNQWDLFEPNGINAPSAWEITTGSSSVVVADLDTGITNHADLIGRSVPGYDFITDVQFANDGDGREADPSDPGDWIALADLSKSIFAGCTVRNSSWHGTHTAGTIGASGNNGLGVAGINWNSKILPVRVLGKCGGYTSDIVDGLRWAAGLPVTGVPVNGNPAKVANLSLGGSGQCGTTWQNAINDSITAGMVVIVAAGNSSQDASNFQPASCNGVITVAATNRNGGRATYSNFGSNVEISAPGGAQTSTNDPNGILSTLNSGMTVPSTDTYVYYQGTSMATPHVTGVVSLMFSLNPFLTPIQVLQILQATARPFPTGSNCNASICGAGMLDAGAAVNAVTTKISRFFPGCGLSGATITVNGMNFTDASAVQFNGTAASFFVTSDTSIRATVPNAATTGPISVISPGGTAMSSASFISGPCYPVFLPLIAH
jgi:serine protease